MSRYLALVGSIILGAGTGLFSPYALLWLGPDRFDEGSPYILAGLGAVGGALCFFLQSHRVTSWVGFPVLGAVAVPTFVFLALGVDITRMEISAIATATGVGLGLSAARLR